MRRLLLGGCIAIGTVFVTLFALIWFSQSKAISDLQTLTPSSSQLEDSLLLDFEHLPPEYPKAVLAADERSAGLPMQLARAVTPPDKHLKHAVKEILLAERIKLQFSEREIVTMYANQVYLGPNVHDLNLACVSYFKKDCWKLDLSETAFLAGLARSPNYYLRHMDQGIARRNDVLEEMQRRGMISSQAAAAAEAEPISIGQN